MTTNNSHDQFKSIRMQLKCNNELVVIIILMLLFYTGSDDDDGCVPASLALDLNCTLHYFLLI